MGTLLYFVNGGKEFVFILVDEDKAEVVAEFEEEGYELADEVVIDHYFTTWPTDRRMVAAL